MKHVLLVNSGPALRGEIIIRELREHGFTVHSASTAAEALVLCRRTRPSVVFTDGDASWEDGDGEALVQRIHAEFDRLPIVMMSDSPGPVRRQRALSSGASFCLRKTVNETVLAEMAEIAERSAYSAN